MLQDPKISSLISSHICSDILWRSFRLSPFVYLFLSLSGWSIPPLLSVLDVWSQTYRVYNHRAKNSRSHSFSIFGVIVCAHHAVVVCGEHASDCAEDYDAKDGDDDAVSGSLPC